VLEGLGGADRRIELNAGRTNSVVFAQGGEERGRTQERKVKQDVADKKKTGKL
jgi:hypothetical protein